MSLTVEQSSALEQLWAVTASATTLERERDERLLRENGWDVQRTIEQIFSTSSNVAPAGPSRMQPMEMDDSLTALLGSRPSGPRRGPSRTAGINGVGLGILGLISWPVTTIFSIISGAWYLFIRTFIPLSFLPHLPRFLRPPSPTSSTSRSGPRDPTMASLTFVRELETFTGCSSPAGTMPEFWIGSYRDFLTSVRKDGKIGLVVLVCGEHEDDEEFKRDVLCDPELVRCLRENEIMVWAGDVRCREGYQVSQTLLTTTYPSLTFLSLLPSPSQGNTASSTPRLTILTSLSGPPGTTTSTASLIQTITTSILPRTSTFLARLRRERFSLEEARHLRSEQDRAFRDAERRDRDKMQVQRQKDESIRIQKERAEREEREKVERIEKRRVWRRYARKHLLPPSTGSTRVALRTPLSAERNLREFTPGPSTVPLFIYAETLLIPASETPESDPDLPPEDYEPDWDFRIVTTYPRREIQRVERVGEAEWDAVKSAGGALFAEKVEGGVWGEAEMKERDGESDEEDVE